MPRSNERHAPPPTHLSLVARTTHRYNDVNKTSRRAFVKVAKVEARAPRRYHEIFGALKNKLNILFQLFQSDKQADKIISCEMYLFLRNEMYCIFASKKCYK